MTKAQIKLIDIKSGIESNFNIGETLDKPSSILQIQIDGQIVKLELTARELRLLAIDILVNQ